MFVYLYLCLCIYSCLIIYVIYVCRYLQVFSLIHVYLFIQNCVVFIFMFMFVLFSCLCLFSIHSVYVCFIYLPLQIFYVEQPNHLIAFELEFEEFLQRIHVISYFHLYVLLLCLFMFGWKIPHYFCLFLSSLCLSVSFSFFLSLSLFLTLPISWIINKESVKFLKSGWSASEFFNNSFTSNS